MTRKLLTIKNPSETDDGQGGKTTVFRSVGKIWADFQSAAGNEQLTGQSHQHLITHTIRTRYSRLVRPDTRLEMADRDQNGNVIVRTLEVDGVVDPGERRKSLEISAVENWS